MRYQISEIKLNAEEYRDEARRIKTIERKAAKKIRGISSEALRDVRIIKESIDARKKPDVKAVFTIDFESHEDLPLKRADGVEGFDPASYGSWKGDIRPVIAGFGPCGMFAALVLATAGARPIVLERGKPVELRVGDVERFRREGILDPESNVQFGEGGAGTFSDGKLTTGIRDERIRWILAKLVEGGAAPDIMYRNKPHIGTDKLREIVPNIRRAIESLGGEVRFSSRLEGIKKDADGLKGVYVKGGSSDDRSGEGCGFIETDCLILATGHSAEDTFRMLLDEGLEMTPKPFSIGVRIEHLQKDIDRAQYGDPHLADVFGPAEYKLSHRCENGRGVYTFCMCPGGYVINASSSEGFGVTNGMSFHARDGKYANSGLLVDVRTDDFEGDDPLAGVAFQKKYEKLAWDAGARGNEDTPGLPVTTYGRFREDEDDPVRGCLPEFAAEGIIEAMPHLGKKLKGFDAEDARMTAVETRSSSPVRITRDENLQSSVYGIIPAGEGPGYAGGIMSAAVDGIRAAKAALDMNKVTGRK